MTWIIAGNIKGAQGNNGANGLSAYQIAQNAGFTGTLSDWLLSLVGPAGAVGPAGTTSWAGITNKPTLFSGSYTDLTNKPTIPTIPTTVSSFTNDANYQTEVQVGASIAAATPSWSSLTGKPTFATVATSGLYGDLAGKPTIPTVPTNVSAFTNDSGYQTAANVTSAISGKANSATTLVGYGITNAYTKTEVDTALSAKQNTGAYLVAADISGKADTSSLASVALSGSYNNLLDKPTIPAAYSLPIASNSVLGGIKIGSGLSIDGAGVVTAASSYSLPVASASVLGGVKQGTGTAIAGDGTISVSGYAPIDAPDFTNGIKSAGKGAIASNFIAGNLAGNAKTSGANGVFIGANAGLVDYASNDNVLIGTDAGKSLVSGVSGLTITNAGTGYSTVPTITISSPAAGGVQATATFLLVSGGAVVAPNITNTGKKYDSTATATVTGGGGTGATVTPIIGAGGRNIAIGTGAFATSISSTEGIAIGYKAQTLNAGGGNTVIGNNSAASTASLSTSVVVGNGSLKSTQTCSASVVIGEGTSTTAFALTNCTVVGSGSASNTDAALASTTIVGTAAGNYAKSNSTLIGYTAGSYCSAQYAIAVGISTISGIFASGAYPVAIGNEALRYQTTGSYNTGVGHQAITTNIVGSNNTAVGYKALSAATTSDNTAVGYLAGTAVSTGASNTFLGSNAGKAINTSSNCVAIGKDALSVATGSADANVCVGNSAGVAIAAAGGNVCVGHFAGAKNTSGASNTFIGLNAGSDVSTGLVDGTNCTIIGAGANASSSSVTNQITLGNTAIQSLRCAATSITSASDARDKTDILPIPVGLDFVKQLQPVIYTWNARDGSRVGIKDCGFLAQDLDVLQDSFNLADNLQLVHKDNPNKLEATFGRLLPIFAQAIKDLAAQNQALLDRIEVLENK